MVKHLVVLAWLATAVLLGGCWDQTSIEDTAFVVSLALDADERGGYLWTFRIIEAQSLPLGSLTVPPEPGNETLSSSIMTVHAHNPEQAVQIAQANIVRIVSLNHLRNIIIGEDLARAGVSPVLNQLLRHYEVRRSAIMQASSGRAEDAMRGSQPVGDTNIVRYLEGANLVQKRVHLAPPVRLQHFQANLLTDGSDPYLPLLTVNPIAKQPEGTLPPATGNEPLDGGTFPRVGGNPAEWAGALIFRADHYAGKINVSQAQALLALRGELGKTYVTVPDPVEEGQMVTLRLGQENKPRYRTSFSAGHPAVDIHLHLDAEVVSWSAKTDYTKPENRRMLEQHVARWTKESLLKPVIETVYHEWGADPVGLGNVFRRRFPVYGAWERYRWHDRVKDLAVNLQVNVFIRRFGMMLNQPPSRER
ncbi:MAG TPA: Ger(x)C family spore germination protein [Symbiobacteriaceae bacterium]|nr:Ger(x)C family spore germination protein [Symbiobacteriaceae bacterium]